MSPHLVIDIRREAPGWASAAPAIETVIRRAARAAWSAGQSEAGGAELSIALVDDAAMRRLNNEWRGKDQPTNVLSFPAGDNTGAPGCPVLLGDVVLALETTTREAAGLRSLGDHVSHLIVHGVLHLLGRDHEAPAEAEAMEALETEILAGLGIADPYQPATGQSAGQSAG